MGKRYVVEKDFEYKGFQCSVILQSFGHRCVAMSILGIHHLEMLTMTT